MASDLGLHCLLKPTFKVNTVISVQGGKYQIFIFESTTALDIKEACRNNFFSLFFFFFFLFIYLFFLHQNIPSG